MSLPQPTKDFEHFLLEKGLRLTSQRRRILESAMAAEGHFTAERLSDVLRTRHSLKAGRATVYRTVKLMEEAGLLKAVDTGKGGIAYLSRFSRKSSLAEIVCADCGRIETMEAPFMDWYGRAAAAKCGLEATEGRLQIHGNCLKLKTGKCPHKK